MCDMESVTDVLNGAVMAYGLLLMVATSPSSHLHLSLDEDLPKEEKYIEEKDVDDLS